MSPSPRTRTKKVLLAANIDGQLGWPKMFGPREANQAHHRMTRANHFRIASLNLNRHSIYKWNGPANEPYARMLLAWNHYHGNMIRLIARRK